MSTLNTEKRMQNIIQFCNKYDITAYEIEKNTKLTQAGVQRILNNQTKKPRKKTLIIIEKYLNKKYQVDTYNIVQLNEQTADYPMQFSTGLIEKIDHNSPIEIEEDTIENRIANKVVQKLKPYFEEIKQLIKNKVEA